MSKMKLILGKLALCLCEVAVGTLLLIDPVGFTSAIVTAVGVLLLLAGVFSVIDYFYEAPAEACLEKGLAKGVCAVLAGLFLILRSEWLFVTFPLLTVAYGIVILVTGVVRVQWTVDMLRLKTGRWYIAAIGAMLSLICAAVILADPFETTAVLWMFTAISLIVHAVADLVLLIFIALRKD